MRFKGLHNIIQNSKLNCIHHVEGKKPHKNQWTVLVDAQDSLDAGC